MTGPPGAQPPEFEFPFAAARRLQEAASAVADAARDGAHRTPSLAGQAAAGFAGRSREQFDAAVGELEARLRQLAGEADAQADRLADLVGQARRAEERRDEAIAAWRREVVEWQAQEDADGG